MRRVRPRLLLCAWVLQLAAASLGAQQARAPDIEEARRLHHDGKLDEALALYDQVAAAPATPPADAAAAHNNACSILIDRGGYREARQRCEAAVELRRQAGEPEPLARALNNLGLALRFLGSYEEAERNVTEALAINRERGDAEAQAVNLTNLGVTAEAAGHYAEALARHREVESLAAAHAAAPWAQRQRQIARVNQGVVLEKINAFRDALDLYETVEEDALELADRALFNENEGVIYRNLGDPVSALEAYRRAEALYERLGSDAARANAALNVAIVHHLNLARPAAAEAHYRRALDLARRTGDLEVEMRALYFLGRLLLEHGRSDEAEKSFRRCLAAAERSGSREGRWSALEGLARTTAGRGELEAALAAAQGAITEIEQVRASLSQAAAGDRRADLAAGFFGARRPVYALAVEILARMHARAGTRPEDLVPTSAPGSPGPPEPASAGPAVAARAGGSGASAAALAFEIVQRAKARDLLDVLGPTRRPVEPTVVEEIQARLAPRQRVFEYFVGEENLFLWTVDATGIEMTALGPPEPLLGAATRVFEDLAAGRRPEGGTLAFLSRSLLGDLRPPGGPGEETEAWTIAPDQRLHYLPFEMLPLPGTGGSVVLDRAEVSYVPSASAIAWLTGARHDHTFELAGFGDPVLPSPGAASRASVLAAAFELQRLPAARPELEAAARWLGGESELRFGAQADEPEFRRLAEAGARVVHLVTHTVVDERPGRGAAILLSESAGEDGLLNPEEIVALDYQVDLTVLAACRSALGWGEGASSLASLTGSFLAAGSAGVVATLWDVGDRASATFMEQFYYELGRGAAPAAALRAAKLRLRRDARWAEPTLWAPYVLVGQPPPVAGRGVAAVLGWVTGALALAALAAATLLRPGLRGAGSRILAARSGRPRPARPRSGRPPR